ncbi:hypothetical protein OH77DRAFT_116872 [Trametes cingulata]|nr:hypothetical protein OH77DRAFT_116872 [Trametes cingulata]
MSITAYRCVSKAPDLDRHVFAKRTAHHWEPACDYRCIYPSRGAACLRFTHQRDLSPACACRRRLSQAPGCVRIRPFPRAIATIALTSTVDICRRRCPSSRRGGPGNPRSTRLGLRCSSRALRTHGRRSGPSARSSRARARAPRPASANRPRAPAANQTTRSRAFSGLVLVRSPSTLAQSATGLVSPDLDLSLAALRPAAHSASRRARSFSNPESGVRTEQPVSSTQLRFPRPTAAPPHWHSRSHSQHRTDDESA